MDPDEAAREEAASEPAPAAEPPSPEQGAAPAVDASPPILAISAETSSAEQGAAPVVDVSSSTLVTSAEPAPPPAPPAPEVEPLPDFRPSAARRFIVAPFWAGLLAAGTGFWVGGFYGSLFESRLLARPSEGVFLLLCFGAALVMGLVRGFRDPVRSYLALLGRSVAVFFFAGLLAAVSALPIAATFDTVHPSSSSALLTFSLFGMLLAGLALARIHGIGAEVPRRKRIAVGVGVVLLVTLWPASPRLRCTLGFAEGCREAARAADSDRDIARFGERGCNRDDLTSCYLAGLAYQRGESVRRDPAKAERLFRTACALGDAESCGRAHGLDLSRACERFSAVACRDLAKAYALGTEIDADRPASLRFYRKACLLGADDACAPAGIR
jgi:hypothetical protein